MISDRDIDALVEFLAQLFFRHLDDFFTLNHIIHRNPGNQLLKPAGILLRKLEHLLRSGIWDPIPAAFLKNDALPHHDNFLSLFIC